MSASIPIYYTVVGTKRSGSNYLQTILSKNGLSETPEIFHRSRYEKYLKTIQTDNFDLALWIKSLFASNHDISCYIAEIFSAYKFWKKTLNKNNMDHLKIVYEELIDHPNENFTNIFEYFGVQKRGEPTTVYYKKYHQYLTFNTGYRFLIPLRLMEIRMKFSVIYPLSVLLKTKSQFYSSLLNYIYKS